MPSSSSNLAIQATVHCLTGCAIGEVVGMVMSTAFGWSAAPSVVISIILAFVFGYSLSIRPLLKQNFGLSKSLRLSLAADTISITIMELADNAFILIVPNAINAGLTTLLFWLSLGLSLVVAFIAALPINRFLIARGKGQAMTHH